MKTETALCMLRLLCGRETAGAAPRPACTEIFDHNTSVLVRVVANLSALRSSREKTSDAEESEEIAHAASDGCWLSLGEVLGPAGALLPAAALAVPSLSWLASHDCESDSDISSKTEGLPGRPSDSEKMSDILAGAGSLSLNRLELE